MPAGARAPALSAGPALAAWPRLGRSAPCSSSPVLPAPPAPDAAAVVAVPPPAPPAAAAAAAAAVAAPAAAPAAGPEAAPVPPLDGARLLPASSTNGTDEPLGGRGAATLSKKSAAADDAAAAAAAVLPPPPPPPPPLLLVRWTSCLWCDGGVKTGAWYDEWWSPSLPRATALRCSSFVCRGGVRKRMLVFFDAGKKGALGVGARSSRRRRSQSKSGVFGSPALAAIQRARAEAVQEGPHRAQAASGGARARQVRHGRKRRRGSSRWRRRGGRLGKEEELGLRRHCAAHVMAAVNGGGRDTRVRLEGAGKGRFPKGCVKRGAFERGATSEQRKQGGTTRLGMGVWIRAGGV